MRNTPNWDTDRIKTVLETTDNTSIGLAEKDRMPVYIYYVTAWADEAGTLYFRPDLYKRDELLIKKFRESKLEREQIQKEQKT